MIRVVRNLSTLGLAIMVTFFGQFVHAGGFDKTVQPSTLADQLKNGGLLYDNWLAVTHTQLSDTNPGYPQSSAKTGKNTWRCKECHGWDYIGLKGRYKEGSHYTGIKGLFESRRKKSLNLYNELQSGRPGHDFSTYLTHQQRLDLVEFIRQGQFDITSVIDIQGRASGSTSKGKYLYEIQCAACHGLNGNQIDFKGKKSGIQGVGWLSLENPQETLHKIRWGHPGSNMPSMIAESGLSDEDTVDILTYGQTLSNK